MRSFLNVGNIPNDMKHGSSFSLRKLAGFIVLEDETIFIYSSMIYVHRKDRYVFKAFQEENMAIDEWVKYMKKKLELLGSVNLMGNMCKVITGAISKEKYQPKNSETSN